jgi:hypothetical protein
MNMEHHRAMLATLNEIRANIGNIQLRMERQGSKSSSSSAVEQSPPPTPRDSDPRPVRPSDDKTARGKAHDTMGAYVPPPARGAQIPRPNPALDDPFPHRRTDEHFHNHHRDTDSHHHHHALPKIHFS